MICKRNLFKESFVRNELRGEGISELEIGLLQEVMSYDH